MFVYRWPMVLDGYGATLTACDVAFGGNLLVFLFSRHIRRISSLLNIFIYDLFTLFVIL